MADNDEIDFEAIAKKAAKLKAVDHVPEDGDDVEADDIPAELLELSVALDTGTAEGTAKAAAELKGMA